MNNYNNNTFFASCPYCENDREISYSEHYIPTCPRCETPLQFYCTKCNTEVNYWNKNKTWTLNSHGEVFHYTCLPMGYHIIKWLFRAGIISLIFVVISLSMTFVPLQASSYSWEESNDFSILKEINFDGIFRLDLVKEEPEQDNSTYLRLNIPRQAVGFRNLLIFGGGKVSFNGLKRELLWGSHYKINDFTYIGLTGHKVFGEEGTSFIGIGITVKW